MESTGAVRTDAAEWSANRRAQALEAPGAGAQELGHEWREKKLEGGYVELPLSYLSEAWRLYNADRLRFHDLRVLFGLLSCEGGWQRACGVSFAVLDALGVFCADSLQRSLARLVAHEALELDDRGCFTLNRRLGSESESAASAALPHAHRRVPFSRRLARRLAQHCGHVLVGTVIGLAARGLWQRDGHIELVGRCSAAWIAQQYGLGLSSVRAALRQLREESWIVSLHDAQRSTHLDRLHGPRYAFNPYAKGFTRLRAKSGGVGSRARAKSGGVKDTGIPISEDRDLKIHIRPERAARDGASHDPVQSTDVAFAVAADGAQRVVPHLERADLQRSAVLDTVFERGAAAGRWSGSEAARLDLYAQAQRALRCGTRNAVGLFVRSLSAGWSDRISQLDEDRGHALLRRAQGTAVPLGLRTCSLSALAEVELSTECAAALGAAVRARSAELAGAPLAQAVCSARSGPSAARNAESDCGVVRPRVGSAANARVLTSAEANQELIGLLERTGAERSEKNRLYAQACTILTRQSQRGRRIRSADVAEVVSALWDDAQWARAG